MDILLVNSPLFDEPGTHHGDALPPLGLGYLATAVQNAGLEVTLLDAVADDCGTAGVISTIQSLQPKFVGLNVFSTNLDLVLKIVTAHFSSHIILGGPAIRALADIVLEWKTKNQITVIEGEAEHALPAFLKGQLVAQPWQARTDRSVLRIPSDHDLFPHDIDLPLRRGFFQNEPIFDAEWNVKEAHIIASRGCAHDCGFCAAARSVNQLPIRFRSDSDIRRELDQIRFHMPDVSGIRIIDDLFIRSHAAIERACNIFLDTGLTWRAMAHVNGFRGVERPLFDKMKRSGCLELFVGVESGSPSRREAIGKPSAVEPTITLATNLFRSQIAVKAYFIYGFPGETKQEMKDTYAVARTMADAALQVGTRFRTSVFKYRPYHGTRLYNDLVASGVKVGRIAPDTKLTTDSGRQMFSFTCENYSSVDLETLNGFILATQEIRS